MKIAHSCHGPLANLTQEKYFDFARVIYNVCDLFENKQEFYTYADNTTTFPLNKILVTCREKDKKILH